jgi:hypothetical protein
MTNTPLPHITLKNLYSTKNVFKKPRNPWKILNLSEKIFKNNWNLYKSPTFLNRSLHFSRNVFQMSSKFLTFLNESLHFFENVFTVFFKASHHFKKASISLKSLISLNLWKSLKLIKKSLNFSENVFKKPRSFYKSLTLSLKISSKSLKIVQNASHY